MKQWECVIGLEVHIQLATKSKIFSGASTKFGAEPNAHACLIDVALPGILPVCNLEAVRMAVKFGLAVGASINRKSVFARKNYFYPDLPKGYQISQLDLPIVVGGFINTQVNGTSRSVRLTRAHLEEDAGKSLHGEIEGFTGIDLNRAGTPLLEIVSEPDIRSPEQAGDYMRKLHAIVTYLKICDGNMQEGSMRCDANVSLRKPGDTEFGTRTELKNINSFRFVEKGIEAEIRRQAEVLENGGTIKQETRQFDPQSNKTRPMRGKEDAQDYRYFPDPDLPPLVLSDEFIESIRQQLPELPDSKKNRFMQQYGLNENDSSQIVQSFSTAEFFEAALAEAPSQPKSIANWINVELTSYLNRHGLAIEDSLVSPQKLGQLVERISKGVISGNGGKLLLEGLWNKPEMTIDELIVELGLELDSNSDTANNLVDQVLRDHPGQIEQYHSGNKKILGYLVGQVLKSSTEKLDPKLVNELLRQKLDN